MTAADKIGYARPLAEPIPARGRLSVWWPDATLQALLASARFAAMEVARAQ